MSPPKITNVPDLNVVQSQRAIVFGLVVQQERQHSMEHGIVACEGQQPALCHKAEHGTTSGGSNGTCIY